MLKNKMIVALVASFFLLATAPGAQAQKTMTERTLGPVENASCGALFNGDVEYGCRMVFWGIYVADHQLVCEELGIKDLDGCDFPQEPPRGSNLLIPGASATAIEPRIGDSDGVASGDASGIKEFVRCVAEINPVIGVPITDQLVQCLVASGIGDFVVCWGNWNLYPIIPDVESKLKNCPTPIAAATFLLIPGASATAIEPRIGDGDGVASGDASGIPEFVICMGNVNLVIAVVIVDDINRCAAASGIPEFVICMGNVNLVIAVVIVDDINRCAAALLLIPGASATAIEPRIGDGDGVASGDASGIGDFVVCVGTINLPLVTPVYYVDHVARCSAGAAADVGDFVVCVGTINLPLVSPVYYVDQFTDCAAYLLLIPGASATAIEPRIGHGDGVASGDASGIKEFVRCVAEINPVIGVPITDQLAQCLAGAASGIGAFVICMANFLHIFPVTVGDIKQCTAVLFSDAGSNVSPNF